MWSLTWRQQGFLRFMTASSELAAVKMKNGVVVDKFEEFIDPVHPLSATTIQLTGITDEMVRGSKSGTSLKRIP